MKSKFYLKASALRGRIDARGYADDAKWRERFPDIDSAIVARAKDTFPATAPETFAAWLGIRSAITVADEAEEPLLRPEVDRSTIFPLRDDKMWDYRKQIQAVSWVAEEVDLSLDRNDWEKVSPAEFQLIKKTLAWFGPADEVIMGGLQEVAMKAVRAMEGQHYLRAQCEQECIHSESYSLQIQEVLPAADRDEILQYVQTSPIVARVADWIRWWVVAKHPLADFIAMMAITEGVLFSGFFVVPAYFRTKGVFAGVGILNEFISRDENIHTRWWCFLLTERLRKRPDEEVVFGITRQTVSLSDEFFEDALPVGIPGINAALMSQYVRYAADFVLTQMGYSPLYGESNPFAFMDMLSLNEVGKNNFFEYQSTQYQNPLTRSAREFTIHGI